MIKRLKKFIFPSTGIITVLFLSYAAFAYVAPSISVNPSNMQQYRNNQHGYIISHSLEWIKREENTNLVRLLLSQNSEISIAINTKQNSDNIPIEKWAFNKFDGTPMHLVRVVKINGLSGLEYSGNLFGDSTFILLADGNQVHEIEYFTPLGKSEENLVEFKEFLNSFRKPN